MQTSHPSGGQRRYATTGKPNWNWEAMSALRLLELWPGAARGARHQIFRKISLRYSTDIAAQHINT